MASVMVMQGRELNPSDIEGIRGLFQAHPEWNRSRLSRELCGVWDWRNAAGRPKDMAARTLLLKLERAGCIALPARRSPSANARRNLQHLTNNTHFLIPRSVRVPHLASHVLRHECG